SQSGEDQPRRFTAGEGAELLLSLGAAEEHQPEVSSDEAAVLAGAEVPQPLLGGAILLSQLLVMVLREVSRSGLVSPLRLARVGRYLTHHDLQQRRLADTVRPHDHQAIAALDFETYIVQDLVVA